VIFIFELRTYWLLETRPAPRMAKFTGEIREGGPCLRGLAGGMAGVPSRFGGSGSGFTLAQEGG
jgi:hypothetical protein